MNIADQIEQIIREQNKCQAIRQRKLLEELARVQS